MEIVEKPTVHCEKCDSELRPGSLRRHQRTPGCIAQAKHRELLAQGWTHELWRNSHDVKRSVWLNQAQSVHACEAPTSYHPGGWGRTNYVQSRQYLRESIVAMYYSPQVTDGEFKRMCQLPESDPEYQALYTLVRLGGENE